MTDRCLWLKGHMKFSSATLPSLLQRKILGIKLECQHWGPQGDSLFFFLQLFPCLPPCLFAFSNFSYNYVWT